MELLEGVDQGWTRGKGQSFLFRKNISKDTLIAWLRDFAQRVRQNPEQHRELGRRLQKLGNLAWRELSPVAARLAQELVVVEKPREEGTDTEVDGDGLVTDEEEAKDTITDFILSILTRQYKQGDLLGAITSVDKCLEIKSDDHKLWTIKGSLLSELGRYEEAIDSFNRAVTIEMNYPSAWYHKGLALYHLGRNEEALINYDQALKINSDYYEAWNNRGNVLRELGEYEEVIASFDRALEIKGDIYEAWLNRGQCVGKLHSAPLPSSALTRQYPQLNQRGFEGALASYQLGLTFCTQDQHPQGWGLLHYEIGRTYYYRGRKSLYTRDAGRSDFREALKHYNQALQTLTREAYPQDHLELIQYLIRVHNALHNEDERKKWRNEGLEVWSQLLNDPHKSSQQKRQLAIQFIRFARMRVDVLLEDNLLLEAFRAAEEQKNLYLTWILDRQNQHILSPTTRDI
ncbi:hypothetical protein BI308_21965 [Roseofilum reptotaenium AO1-A]|uniref:Uncharacterized protein n=2 Tax=Roseofilum TaxID=1233426 RepID=A0A1L9QL61_9CYAN|nr:hypothetical protein BI308_21965 [Roseofilum reptotaenium AO1-A]